MSQELIKKPTAETGMLIRKPVEEVFEAFVNPGITTKFWFTASTGRLEAGKEVRWDWEMYGVSDTVDVKEIKPNNLVRFEWGSEGEPRTAVEWVFTPYKDDSTFVSITNSDFAGTADEQVSAAINSLGGFSLVLAAAKAWLEHGLDLKLVADRFPPGISEH